MYWLHRCWLWRRFTKKKRRTLFHFSRGRSPTNHLQKLFFRLKQKPDFWVSKQETITKYFLTIFWRNPTKPNLLSFVVVNLPLAGVHPPHIIQPTPPLGDNSFFTCFHWFPAINYPQKQWLLKIICHPLFAFNKSSEKKSECKTSARVTFGESWPGRCVSAVSKLLGQI